MEWSSDEITAWILNLDPERMKKYEMTLEKTLFEIELKRTLLAEVDGADLKQWGIIDGKDRKYVMGERVSERGVLPVV